MRAKLLFAGGALAFITAIFHSFFWVMFDWAGELPRLSHENAAIMEMLNIVTIFVCAYQGFASWALARKREPLSVAEKSILVFIGGFYFLRGAFGFPLFGLTASEVVVVTLCMLMILTNLWALKSFPGREPARRI